MAPLTIRLGIFWFVPGETGGTRLIEKSASASDIPLIGGFKTLEAGHVDVWKDIVRKEPSLRGHPYEEYPRGRANWRAEDDAWLLLMDKAVIKPAFIAAIRQAWHLPENTIVMTDPHYRCKTPVALPVLS